MALSTPALLTEGSDDANVTTGNAYSTAAFTPSANALVLLSFVTHNEITDPTVAGHSLTWTQVAAVDFNTIGTPNDRLFLYRAQAGASPSSNAITITVAGNATGCQWKVWEYASGFDTTTPIVQFDTNADDANSNTNMACALAAGAAGNHTNYMSAWDVASNTYNLDTSPTYVEIGSYANSTGSAPGSALGVSYATSVDTVPSASSGSGPRDWASIAVEIGAASTGVERAPGAGSATLAGLAAVLGFTFGLGLGAAVFTGPEPTVLDETPGTDVPMNPDLQALVIAGAVPPLNFGILMPDEP